MSGSRAAAGKEASRQPLARGGPSAGRPLTQEEPSCPGRSQGGVLSRAPHGRPSLEGSWHPGHFLPESLIPEKRANLFPLQTMLEGKPLSACSAPLLRGQLHIATEESF